MNATCDKCENKPLMVITKTEVMLSGPRSTVYVSDQECTTCGRKLRFLIPCMELPNAAKSPASKCPTCDCNGEVVGPSMSGMMELRWPRSCPACKR